MKGWRVSGGDWVRGWSLCRGRDGRGSGGRGSLWNRGGVPFRGGTGIRGCRGKAGESGGEIGSRGGRRVDLCGGGLWDWRGDRIRVGADERRERGRGVVSGSRRGAVGEDCDPVRSGGRGFQDGRRGRDSEAGRREEHPRGSGAGAAEWCVRSGGRLVGWRTVGGNRPAAGRSRDRGEEVRGGLVRDRRVAVAVRRTGGRGGSPSHDLDRGASRAGLGGAGRARFRGRDRIRVRGAGAGRQVGASRVGRRLERRLEWRGWRLRGG